MTVDGVVAHLPGVGRNDRGRKCASEDERLRQSGDRRLIEGTQLCPHADPHEPEEEQPVEHPKEDPSTPRSNEGADGETKEHERNERRAFDVERIPRAIHSGAEQKGAEIARLSADCRERTAPTSVTASTTPIVV